MVVCRSMFIIEIVQQLHHCFLFRQFNTILL